MLGASSPCAARRVGRIAGASFAVAKLIGVFFLVFAILLLFGLAIF